MMERLRRIVALSGGKDSTAMALRLAEMEPSWHYEYICTPTGNELPEMIEHWRNLGQLLGKPIMPITGNSLQGLIRRQKALPNHRMRWCTRMIKIEPFRAFILNAIPCVVYVGIRADEAEDRDGVDWSSIQGVVHRYPMVEWGWGLSDVKAYLSRRNITVPKRTDCAMCFFQTLGEWWNLYRNYPEHYAEAMGYEEMTGHTLRSEQRDSWPASLRELKAEFDKGATPRGASQLGLFSMEDRKAMCSFCAR